MKVLPSLSLAILQPNSTANLPSQAAILDSILFASSNIIVIVFGSSQCLSLAKQLVDDNKYTLICIPRVPGFIRSLSSTVLSILAHYLALDATNIVVSHISPSLSLRGGRTIFSGDGFGFSNLPSWNPALANRKSYVHQINCENFAPYTLTPDYEEFRNGICNTPPRILINNASIHTRIISSLNSLDSVSQSCFGCQSVGDYFKAACTLVAMSAFSENYRITPSDEIQIILYRLKQVARCDSTIFLKPHPFNSELKVQSLFRQLKDIYPKVYIVPDIFPVEYLLCYAFKNFCSFKFLSFQQSALSSLLIDAVRGKEVLEFGFGISLIERFWCKEDMQSRIIYEDWISSAIKNFSVKSKGV